VKIKSNKIKDIRDYHLEKLTEIYPASEAGNMLDILFEDLMDITKTQRLANPDLRVSESEMLTIHFAAKSLLDEVPVQYITGISWFFGLKIQVNPSVLIPRPETEELVEWVINDYHHLKPAKLLDLGTGSGAIALGLKHVLRNAIVSACDNSPEALEVAKENSRSLSLDIDFRLTDILNEKNWKHFSGLDVIVSNPPYIPPSEKKMMNANVLNHEPESALFVPENDPLIFYKKIAAFGNHALKTGGRLYFEINERFGKEVVALLVESGYTKVELRKDLNGKDRMVRGDC